jgi:hypothetical protein
MYDVNVVLKMLEGSFTLHANLNNLILVLASRLKGGLLGLLVRFPLGVSLLNGLLEGLIDVRELVLLLASGVLPYGGVDLLVQLLEVISLQIVGNIGSEVLLVVFLVVLLHLAHVVGDVLAHDVLLVDGGVELVSISGVAGETLVGVGDVQATVAGTLHGTEDTSTGGGVLDADIEEGAEGLLLVVELLDVVGATVVALGGHDLAGGLLNTSVDLIKANLLQESASAEKASAVSSGVVLKADTEAVFGELGGGSRAENLVTLDLGVDDLDENESVGEANNKAVLRGLVLVLVLGDELVALTVVSAALCERISGIEIATSQ